MATEAVPEFIDEMLVEMHCARANCYPPRRGV